MHVDFDSLFLVAASNMNEPIPRAAVLPTPSQKFVVMPRSGWRLFQGFAIVCFLIGWIGPPSTAIAPANEVDSSNSMGSSSKNITTNATEYVLLRNDRVLQGNVQVGGESVIVRRGGSEIRLPAKEVIGSRNDLDALFELREQWRSTRTSSRPIQRALSAARWCVDQGLHRQAVEQLMIVYHADPENSEARHLESRLRNLVRPDDSPSQGNEVSQAGFAESTNETDQANTSTSTDKPIDRLHEEVMNSWLLHAFTARVQPILLAKCAQCHDQSDRGGDFALHRAVHSNRPGRRITDANLRAVLKLCVPGSPDTSQLIQMAKADHGAKSSHRDASTSLPSGSVLLRTLESFVVQLPLPSERKAAEIELVVAETPRASDPNPVAQASFVEETSDAEFFGAEEEAPAQWTPSAAHESTPSQSANSEATKADERAPIRPKRLPKVEQPLSKDLFNRQTELIELFRATLHSTAK